MTRYAMAIDLGRCIGCHTCAVACKVNNNLPDGLWYNRVITEGGAYLDTAAGTYPNDLSRTFWPRSCQHCETPACMPVCPVAAIEKRDDGIVTQDNEKCIGCKLCITACPYEARVFNESEPAYPLTFKFGDWDAPEHIAQKAEKCTFCANRIDRGEVPACMDLCPGRARYWGDLDDPTSEVSAYLKGKQSIRLLEEHGTNPSVYFISK